MAKRRYLIMKFLKKIFKKEGQIAVNDLIRAHRELATHITDLQRAESEAKSTLIRLEKKALVEDVEQFNLEQVRQRAFSYGPKIEAAEQTQEDIKSQILKALPLEKKKRLERLNREQETFRKLLQEQKVELMRSLARVAVFMEVTDGASADSWLSSFNIPLKIIQGVVNRDRHAFVTQLEKAKTEIEAYRNLGNLPTKIKELELEGHRLFRREFVEQDVGKVLETGELRWQNL
jgi:hypothetical protein